MMTYKNYVAVVNFDDEAGVLRGQVTNLRDVITFQGKTVDEVRLAFHESVDDYLEFCAERGEKPERPFNGKILLRVTPEVHRTLSTLAVYQKISVNELISRQVELLAYQTRQQIFAKDTMRSIPVTLSTCHVYPGIRPITHSGIAPHINPMFMHILPDGSFEISSDASMAIPEDRLRAAFQELDSSKADSPPNLDKSKPTKKYL